MKFSHEVIQVTNQLPFRAFTFRAHDSKRIIPQHWHQSTELIYCLDGALNIWLNGVLYQMHQNDIVVVNANVIHATQSPMPNHVLCIQLPLPFLRNLTSDRFNLEFIFNLNTVQTSQPELHSVHDCLNQLTTIVDTKAPISLSHQIEEQSLVLHLLSQLIARYTVAPSRQSFGATPEIIELMSQVTDYLNAHFDERLTLHQIASHFNYSDSYFSRHFKASFNMNFHDFLVSIRLNDAVNRLVTTHETLSQIAVLSGFETYRNFYNAFVSVYQVTPHEFRENYL